MAPTSSRRLGWKSSELSIARHLISTQTRFTLDSTVSDQYPIADHASNPGYGVVAMSRYSDQQRALANDGGSDIDCNTRT